MKKRLFPVCLAFLLVLASMLALTACGVGGSPTCTNHIDNSKDHQCDTCSKVLSACEDKNKDHNCDVCGKVLSACEDKSKDHNCDVCGETLSACADTDGDGLCDACNTKVSTGGGENLPPHTCTDANSDHKCDTCDEALTACTDHNSDHACDLCKKTLSYCTDRNNNHACDLCAKPLSSCIDTDADGICDICYSEIAAHDCIDVDGSLICDVCGCFMNCEDDESSPDPGAYINFLGAIKAANAPLPSDTSIHIAAEKKSDRMFLVFTREILSLTFYETNQYTDHGSFMIGDGFFKDGKYLVPLTVTFPEMRPYESFTMTFRCQYVNAAGATAEFEKTISLFYAPSGTQPPVLLGVNLDGKPGNYSDSLTVSEDGLPLVLYCYFDRPIFITYATCETLSFSSKRYLGEIENTYVLALVLKQAEVGIHSLNLYGGYGDHLWQSYPDLTLTLTEGAGGTSATCAHVDLPGDRSHFCVFCNTKTSNCTDKNNDHYCDDCMQKKTECLDGDKDARCDICTKPMDENLGPDGSTPSQTPSYSFIGLSHLDTGDTGSLFFLHGKSSYKFFMHFTAPPKSIRITPSKQGGTYTIGEGYYKEGRYILPITYIPAEGQIPETVYADVNGSTGTTLTIYLTKNCVIPSFLGASLDGNPSNATNALTLGFTEIANASPDKKIPIYLHFDAPLSGSHISGISVYDRQMSYENGIYTIKAFLNSNKVGTHQVSVSFFYGPSLQLLMNFNKLFTLTVLPGIPCSTCADSSTRPDGYCDTCGNALSCAHKDENSDHICDACKESISQCEDKNSDHICDVCKKNISNCKDENKDHNCDICKEKLSDCEDKDGDDNCDVCNAPLKSDECKHEDADADHACDLCKRLVFCKDEDLDGYCDECKQLIEGIDALKDPYLIGYSTEKYGSFFEAFGAIPLSYNTSKTLYLKFNCEVALFEVAFDSGLASAEYCYTDTQGAVYSIVIPAFDRIFSQRDIPIFFQTPYGSGQAQILIQCLPEQMPEFLGFVLDGEIVDGAISVPESGTMLLQFAMTTEVKIDEILLSGSALQIQSASAEQVTTDKGEVYWLYTVSIDDQGSITDFNLELCMHYTYLGANTHEMEGFLPAFYMQVQKVFYLVSNLAVNGTSVVSDAAVPYANSYEIEVILNQSASCVQLLYNGGSVMSTPDESNPHRFTFTLSDLYGYQDFHIEIITGDGYQVPASFPLSLWFAENAGEDDGAEGEIPKLV